MSIIDLLRQHVVLPQGTWNEKGPVIFLNEVEKWEVECYDYESGKDEWFQVNMVQCYREEDGEHVLVIPKEIVENTLKEWVEEESSHRLLFLFGEKEIKTSLRRNIHYCKSEYNQSIGELSMSIRAYNTLTRDGYKKIGDLQYVTDLYLEETFPQGTNTQRHIREMQRELGFRR